MEKFGGVGWWEYLSGEDDCFLFFESTTPATAGRVQIEYTLVGLARTIYIRCIYTVLANPTLLPDSELYPLSGPSTPTSQPQQEGCKLSTPFAPFALI